VTCGWLTGLLCMRELMGIRSLVTWQGQFV